MLQDYRNAVAGSAVTVAAFFASRYAGLDVPAEVGAAAVTLVVFGLGFLPKPPAEPPPA